MACSGIHRKLGTHISQVRSITLDTWTPSQIAHFQKLGNAKAERYFEACLPADFRRPHSSDSMRMEAFIRDKYEHRRFITVENGGLGGAEMRSSSSSALKSLGPRPKQAAPPRRPYDDVRLSSSSSYGASFNHSRSHAPQPSDLSKSSLRNPLARATTLKELVNMGFSTDLALRAVEASDGDLQRAVDWVVHNSGHAKTESSFQSVCSNPFETDLLDFSDDSVPNPSTMSCTTTPTTTLQLVAGGKQPKPSYVADFADFGDFESALPSVKTVQPENKPVASASNAIDKGEHNGNLADLYHKLAPSAITKKRENLNSKLSNNSTQAGTSLQVVKSVSNALTEKSSPEHPVGRLSPKAAVDSSKLGLPFIDLKDTSTRARIQRANPIMNNHVSKSNPKPTPGPPPPPPIQEAAIMTATGGPPPPSPPANKSQQMSEERTRGESMAVEPQVSKEERPEKAFREQGDEDPFAALSMMALSSASKKKPNPTIASERIPPKEVKIDATTTSSNGNVDDLLGL